MKQYLLGLFLLIVFFSSCANPTPQTGYEIKVTLKPFKNTYIYLGHYLGGQTPIIDSTYVDENSTGVFKGDSALAGGIYLIGYPQKDGFFEILVDKEQHFSVVTDTTHQHENITYKHSEDGTLFFAYQQEMKKGGVKIEEARRGLQLSSNRSDSAIWEEKIIAVDKEMKAYREDFIAKHPKRLLSMYLKAMREPEIPAALAAPNTRDDSIAQFQYVKTNFLRDVPFWDGRLAYTPFFEPKIDKYFANYVALSPDSVITEIDYMLGLAVASPIMNKFLLLKFTNRYLNQKYIWEDAVFVHLYEKYYSQKSYPWLNESARKTITNRAYSLIGNLMGKPAEEILLPDVTGNTKSLYQENAAMTLVIFWDVTCGHCKEVLPKIKDLYDSKWKAKNIKIYAVSKETDGNPTLWKNFIQEQGLQEWTNVYYSKEAELQRINKNIPGYNQLYDVQSFPTIYLLDKDKRILAKKLTYEQMAQIIETKTSGN